MMIISSRPNRSQPLPPIDSPTAESLPEIMNDDDGDSSRDDADGEDKDDEDEEEERSLAPPTHAILELEQTSGHDYSISITYLHLTYTPLYRGATVQRHMPHPHIHYHHPCILSPLLPSSGCPTQIQTLRIASTQALINAVTAALPSPPLPPLPPSLYIPPPVDCKGEYSRQSSSLARGWLDISQRVEWTRSGSIYLCGIGILSQGDSMEGEEEAYASREAWAHLKYG
ncbi:hypothetical protein Tco_0216612 [Tanacetum coccineum]